MGCFIGYNYLVFNIKTQIVMHKQGESNSMNYNGINAYLEDEILEENR
jgi:hypothetical protein